MSRDDTHYAVTALAHNAYKKHNTLKWVIKMSRDDAPIDYMFWLGISLSLIPIVYILIKILDDIL